MKKVAFHNLGCKVNSYELDGIMQNFQKAGYEIVDFAQEADIYVVNTCSVTNVADRKSRQMLHRAKALNPNALVVATGCYVQTDSEGAKVDESIDLIIGNNEKAKLFDYVEEYLDEKSKGCLNSNNADAKTLGGKTIADLKAPIEYENFMIEGSLEHTRAYIKIQDGCDQFCSYCSIPLARGRVRSKKKEDVVEEVKRLAANGYKEIVLTGIHLSSYGLNDAYNIFASGDAYNEELLLVIEMISKVDGIERIRLGSLEPRLITDEFLNRLSKVAKVCPHFHLSLQSGCDSVLKRMNRQYTSAEYAEKTKLIRKYYNHPAITTDVIVGFPGENEEEFEATDKFLDLIDLYETHIFKYSRRKGTKADKMPGQLTDKIKSHRSKILMDKDAKHRQAFLEYYLGKEVEILTEDIETINGISYRMGYTKEYVRCAVDDAIHPEGVICKATGNAVVNGILICS